MVAIKFMNQKCKCTVYSKFTTGCTVDTVKVDNKKGNIYYGSYGKL
jgi:hypothetical protein